MASRREFMYDNVAMSRICGAGLTGITNPGTNNCWLNSCVQMLAHCRPFVSFFSNFYSHLMVLLAGAPLLPSYPPELAMTPEASATVAAMVAQLAHLLLTVSSCWGLPSDSSLLLGAVFDAVPALEPVDSTETRYTETAPAQQDASEMMKLMWEFVAHVTGIWGSRSAPRALAPDPRAAPPPTLITDLFGGRLSRSGRCEEFLELSIPADGSVRDAVALRLCPRDAGGAEMTTLRDTLETGPEILWLLASRWNGAGNKAGTLEVGSGELLLDDFRPTEQAAAVAAAGAALAVALEVLKGGEGEVDRAALECRSLCYDLVGVICHKSTKVQSGHYVTLASVLPPAPPTPSGPAPAPATVAAAASLHGLSFSDTSSVSKDTWVEFNDETVTPVTFPYVRMCCRGDGYLFCYQQRPTPEQATLRAAAVAAVAADTPDTSPGGETTVLSGLWLWRLAELVHPGPITDVDLCCPFCGGLSPWLPREAPVGEARPAVPVSRALFNRLAKIYGDNSTYHGAIPGQCTCMQKIGEAAALAAQTVNSS